WRRTGEVNRGPDSRALGAPDSRAQGRGRWLVGGPPWPLRHLLHQAALSTRRDGGTRRRAPRQPDHRDAGLVGPFRRNGPGLRSRLKVGRRSGPADRTYKGASWGPDW